MPIGVFQTIRPGRITLETARVLNDALREVERLACMTVAPPLRMHELGGNRILTAEIFEPFPARIDAIAGLAYSWTEQIEIGEGQFGDKPDGLAGTDAIHPAYEVNGNLDVPVGAIVWLYQGFLNSDATGREFLFWYCCGGVPGAGSGSG